MLSSSSKMFSEISSIRQEFFCDSSDSHWYRSVNLSLTLILHHWSQNLLFLLFLCLATGNRWPGSETSRCKCGVAHVLRFQEGKVRQELVDVVVSSGLELTVKEQQRRRVHHEKGECEIERYDTCETNTFLVTLEPCVYVHSHEDVRMCEDKLCNRKMCVRQVSVCTHPSCTL